MKVYHTSHQFGNSSGETLLNTVTKFRDFPGGPMVRNPRCSSGDADLTPGRGTGIPPAAEQLKLGAETTEPTCSASEDPACHNQDPAQPNKQIQRKHTLQ